MLDLRRGRADLVLYAFGFLDAHVFLPVRNVLTPTNLSLLRAAWNLPGA
jgi:hypothetical protein